MPTQEIERNTILGKRRAEDGMAALRDPFAEAPFYGAGKGSENVKALKEGDCISAIFHGLRQSKTGKKSWYAKLQTEAGERIRLFTPGNLKGQLMVKDTGEYRVPVGTYIEITYLGMEVVEDVNNGEPIHKFDLLVDKRVLN